MLLRAACLSSRGIIHGFSTREGGVSALPFGPANFAWNVDDDPQAVEENHRRFAERVGHRVDALVQATQVHGARGLDVDRLQCELPRTGRVLAVEADALWTAESGRAVGVRTADCVPVLLADVEAGVVAAVHAGWRGAVAGVVPRTIEALVRERGCQPETMVAAIGPHIRAASFEVGLDVAGAVAGAMPQGPAAVRAEARAGPVITREGERPRASLAALVLAQLLAAGLRDEHVEDVGGDTFVERDRFHSHRRDGARSGRMLSVIVAP